MGRQRLIRPFRALLARTTPGNRRITLPVAAVAGVSVGSAIALAFLAMPTAVLESMAIDSGIASLVTAAQPPLGLTARLAVAFFAGVLVAGIGWFGLFLLIGGRTMALTRGRDPDGVPVLRRADAHPDAPPRRPVFANSDLGTPFLEVKADPVAPAERALPFDLDTPMAGYLSPLDPPLAVPEAGEAVEEPLPIRHAPEPVAPSPISTFDPGFAELEPAAPQLPEPRFAAHERIETFVMPPAGHDPAAPLPQATIHDLLDRLERGVARRQPAPEPGSASEPVTAAEPAQPSLEDTLEALRSLARRVG